MQGLQGLGWDALESYAGGVLCVLAKGRGLHTWP